MLTKNDIFELFEQGTMNITDLLTPDGEILGLTERFRETSEAEPDDVLDILTEDTIAIGTETEVVSSESVGDQVVAEENLPTVLSCYDLETIGTAEATDIAMAADITPIQPLTIQIRHTSECESVGPLSADAFSTTSSGSELTPLIKEELKYTIKSRRLENGKPDIDVVFQDPEPEMLTEEEMQRRLERRAKNKMAAQKCRTKKRLRAEALEEETEILEQRQDELRKKILKLQDERDHLIEVIKVHRTVCPEL